MNITKLESRLEKQGYIVVLWHIDETKGLRPDQSEEQCREVLGQCKDNLDATIGINWDVISDHAEDLFPEPREAGV